MFIRLTLIFVLILPFVISNYNDTLEDVLSNTRLNTLQIIKKYGYPLERHWVTTQDGYILELQRIPYSPKNKTLLNRPPVLLFHGNLASSREFVLMGNKSIGFVLSEGGYDVWLANARGTSWSRRHKWLSPNFKNFWMFTFHEFGVYDIPAEIDYIRNVTKQDKIFYVGHSQGGTAFCIMMSEKPEMNDKIRLAVLLAPSVYMKHNKNPLLRVATDNIGLLTDIVYSVGLYEIPFNIEYGKILSQLCESRLKFLCYSYVNLVMGHDNDQMDHRLLPAIVSHIPGGFSFKTYQHYSQIIQSGKFQKYDYGSDENLKLYGTTSPPLYNISKITAPVGLMYGRNEVAVNAEDVEDLANDLPNLAFKYKVPYEKWNHIDYLFAKNATELIYNKMVEWMKQY